VLLIAKLFMTGAVVYIEPGSSVQVVCGIFGCFTLYTIQMWLKPYKDKSDDILANLTLADIYITLFLGLLAKTNVLATSSDAERFIVDFILVGATFASSSLGVGMLLYERLVGSSMLEARELRRQKRVEDASRQLRKLLKDNPKKLAERRTALKSGKRARLLDGGLRAGAGQPARRASIGSQKCLVQEFSYNA